MDIHKPIENSITLKTHILNDNVLLASIEKSAEIMIASLKAGGKVLFCGNGGSAVDAQHLAAELSGRFYYDRPPLASDALHCNTSYLTAVGNDYGYDKVYSRLLKGIGKKGDVLVGLSTSGNSANVVEAFKTAAQMGIYTIAFTGSLGGEMKNHCDILINVPSNDTPRIQESHIMLGHIVCEIVESTLFPK